MSDAVREAGLPGASDASRVEVPVLRQRNFRRLFLADCVSQLGNQVTLVALPLVAILVLDAGVLQVGLLTAATTAPFAVFGLPAGAWVDRLPLRPLLVTADVLRGALLLSLPVAYWAGHLTLAHLFAVSLGTGVATVFFDIAYQSYLPALLPRQQLPAGNTVLEMVHSTMQLAGPGVGGWLVAAASAPAALVVDAVSFLGSALFLGRIPSTRRPPVHDRQRLRTEIRVGLQFVLTHPLLRLIVLRSVLANLAFAAVVAVQALYLVRVSGLSPFQYGLALAAGGLGGLLGGALFPRLATRLGSGRILVLAPVVCSPAAFLLLVARPDWRVALVALGLLIEAVGVVLYNIAQVSFRQAVTPPGLLGRMNASVRSLVWGAMPLGGLLGGLLGSAFGVGNALVVALSAQVLSTVPLLVSSRTRRLRDLPSTPEGGVVVRQ